MQWVVGIVTGVVVTGIADEEVVDDEAQVVALLQQTVAESGVLVLLAPAQEVFVSWLLDGRRHLAVANRPEGGEKEVVF